MFEKFTEKAIKVIMLAQEEARRLGHNFVGTEQILLGLIGEATGVAANFLKSMGITLKDARIEVEKIIGRGSGFVAVEIPFTPRAKRVLELSLEEARQLDHNFIGTEHLLLGLVREGEGVAARVLENLGLDLSTVRPKIIHILSGTAKAILVNTVETKREHKNTYKCSHCSNEDKIISPPYKCQICDNSKFILIEDIYIQRVTYPN
jgi:ATP-dependent Clp protease ATP-binding subunit ClpC